MSGKNFYKKLKMLLSGRVLPPPRSRVETEGGDVSTCLVTPSRFSTDARSARCRPNMTHREDPLQEPVVDGFGGADGSVGEEEGSEGGEDGVGHRDAAVDRQVEPDVGARAVGR